MAEAAVDRRRKAEFLTTQSSCLYSALVQKTHALKTDIPSLPRTLERKLRIFYFFYMEYSFGACMSFCWFVCLFVCLFVYLFVCLFSPWRESFIVAVFPTYKKTPGFRKGTESLAHDSDAENQNKPKNQSGAEAKRTVWKAKCTG